MFLHFVLLVTALAVEIFFKKMATSKENIIEEFYSFVKYLLPVVDKFPRFQKFILGDRISNKMLDVHELYIEAYYTPRQLKREKMAKINAHLTQF